MLIKMSEILRRAKEGSYGVPALGAVDELTLRACIDAAEEMKSPMIILCMHNGNKDLNYFGRILTDLAIRSSVPIATMLDHTPTFESAIAGVRAGFNTIMVDRSSLPYKENLAQVKELVRIAHAVDIEVEAELGHVGFEDGSDADSDLVFTVPEEAVSYVEESGIECLAVSIGTAHGAYKGQPKLQYELLQELAGKVNVPLALHGGSGTGDENLAKACRLGISKVNIVNDLYRNAFNAVEKDGMAGNRIYNLLPTLSMGYKEKAMHFMKVFGSAGKA
ncbi:MAG: class II fructose-bisphosphate aldolase [Eubacteriales bacterium]|nr:class II fructose-bisphosphate aldolase [Eubacteriales bacterium]